MRKQKNEKKILKKYCSPAMTERKDDDLIPCIAKNEKNKLTEYNLVKIKNNPNNFDTDPNKPPLTTNLKCRSKVKENNNNYKCQTEDFKIKYADITESFNLDKCKNECKEKKDYFEKKI